MRLVNMSILLLLSCLGTGFNYPKTFQEVGKAAVTIHVSDDDESYLFLGSGAWIKDKYIERNIGSENLVVTAWHVAKNIDEWAYTKVCPALTADECVFVEQAIGPKSNPDIAKDLALLIAVDNMPNARPLRVANEYNIQLGSEVAVVGSNAYESHAVEAYISTITSDSEGLPYFQITGFGQPGMSGSPVVNKQGELIGVYVSLPVILDTVLDQWVIDNHHIACSPAWIYLWSLEPDRCWGLGTGCLSLIE